MVGRDHWIVNALKLRSTTISSATAAAETQSAAAELAQSLAIKKYVLSNPHDIKSASSSSTGGGSRELLDSFGPDRELPGQSLLTSAVDYLESYSQISYSTSGCHPWLIRFGVEIEPSVATAATTPAAAAAGVTTNSSSSSAVMPSPGRRPHSGASRRHPPLSARTSSRPASSSSSTTASVRIQPAVKE